jgi:hypothetical protein
MIGSEIRVIIFTVTRTGGPQKRLLLSWEVQKDFSLSTTAYRLWGLSNLLSKGYRDYFSRRSGKRDSVFFFFFFFVFFLFFFFLGLGS